MHRLTTLPILLILIASIISANALDPPRIPIFESDTQPSCYFDILCAVDSGTTICHERLDVCCQLRDGITSYTCSGLGNSHCCGIDKPACGSDPMCKDIKGDRNVVSAQDVVYLMAVAVSAVPSTTVIKVNLFAGEAGNDDGGEESECYRWGRGFKWDDQGGGGIVDTCCGAGTTLGCF